jgi:hypothetical protein
VPELKRCKKCGTQYEHTTEFFHRSTSGQNGLSSQCKKCRTGHLRDQYASYEHVRVAKKQRQDKMLAELKQEVLGAYGDGLPRCSCCDERCIEFLQLHHVNNDGYLHRVFIGKGYSRILRWAKGNGYPSSLQVLCCNCHWAIHQFGHCPHKISQSSRP